MKKHVSALVFAVSVLALAGMPVFAAETMSPAKKKLLEKTKKEGAPATPAGESGGAKTATIDLNKATKQQLMSLPGISEAEADKIIAGRPYIEKAQLRKKDIIPSATFYGIVDKVTVEVNVKKWESSAPPEKPEKKQRKPKKE
jgi:competence protein ComEA